MTAVPGQGPKRGSGQRTSAGATPGADGSPESGRVAAVVLGMHRSGTSAATRLLSLLGADLPRNLLPANETNEAGHWEPQLVADLNDELLASASTSWHDVGAFPSSWYGSTSEAGFRERAVDLLETEYGSSPLFVLKDPRICRIVPFWLGALGDFGSQPCFVVVVRNPLEVAASLRTRDGFPTAKGLLMWLRHTLDAERDSRGHPRVFISYERLLRDWEAQARLISDQLQLPWPKLNSRARAEVDRFLGVTHRHNEFSVDELVARGGVVDWVKSAYLILEAAGESQVTPDPQALDEIRASLDLAEAAFGPLVAHLEVTEGELAGRVADVEVLISERDSEIEALRTGLGEYEEASAESAAHTEKLLDQLSERESEIEALRSGQEEYEAANSALTENLASQEAQAAELRADLAKRETEAEAASAESAAEAKRLLAQLSERESEIAALRSGQEDYEQVNAALTKEVSSRTAQEDELRADLAERKTDAEAARAELTSQAQRLEALISERDSEIDALRLELEDHTRAATRLKGQLAERIEEMEALRADLSGRLDEVQGLVAARDLEVVELRAAVERETAGARSARESHESLVRLRSQDLDDVAEKQRVLEARGAELRAQTLFIREQDAKLREFEEQVAEARREQRSLVASRSWRITSPFRRLGRRRRS